MRTVKKVTHSAPVSAAPSRRQITGPKQQTVQSVAEKLLLRPLPYDSIVDKVKAVFPEANTSRKSVQWYASRMRARGVRLPERRANA